MSVDIAQSCTYNMPRDKTTIVGKSVRFAEIIANAYGNIRAGARVVDIGPSTVTAQGFCIDLENNTASTVEVKGRIIYKNGNRYNEDMIITTSNALCAKAYRNAVFKTVPMSLFDEVYDEINQYVLDNLEKDTDLPKRTAKCIKAFSEFEVTEEMITKLVGKSKDEWSAKDLQTLLGYFQAIKNNEATVDTIFGKDKTVPEKSKTEPPIVADEYKDALKAVSDSNDLDMFEKINKSAIKSNEDLSKLVEAKRSELSSVKSEK